MSSPCKLSLQHTSAALAAPILPRLLVGSYAPVSLIHCPFIPRHSHREIQPCGVALQYCAYAHAPGDTTHLSCPLSAARSLSTTSLSPTRSSFQLVKRIRRQIPRRRSTLIQPRRSTPICHSGQQTHSPHTHTKEHQESTHSTKS